MVKYSSAALFSVNTREQIRFYQDVLGLELLMDNGEHAAFKCGISIWSRQMAQGLIFGRSQDVSGNSFELYFESDDIESDYNDICAKGCKVITELSEQPWGQIGFRIADIDGNILEFGEKLSETIKRLRDAGMSSSEISLKTHIAEDILDKI